MSRILNIIIVFLIVCSANIRAEVVPDSINLKQVKDTLVSNKKQIIETSKPIIKVVDSLTRKPFKPDPLKSVWMGAIIPGYGQYLNHKYWKLPIVYGGFLGCAFAITWNGTMYNTYRTAYKDIVDNDPNTTSYLDILPKGKTLESIGTTRLTTLLKNKQDAYRRYRDLSIICTIGLYAISMVDAYVDAQLYDFDISPDLSMHVPPTLLQNAVGVPNTLALQCSFQLK